MTPAPIVIPPEPQPGQPWQDYARALYQWASTDSSLLAGGTRVNTQRPDGTWTLGRAYVDRCHGAGLQVLWVTDGSVGRWPTITDGLADGDLVNGARPTTATLGTTTTITVPAWATPAPVDRTGVDGDAVRLSLVPGVSWRVNGVTVDPSTFTAEQYDVPVPTGAPTTVTAVPTSPLLTALTGTTTWTVPLTSGTAQDAVVTSDNFTGVSGPITPGTYLTDGGRGGPPTPIQVTKVGLSVVNGALRFSGDAAYRSVVNEQALAVEFTVNGTAASGNAPLIVHVARSDNGETACGIQIRESAADLIVTTGYSQTVAATFPVQSGDWLRVSYKDGQVWVLRGGQEIARAAAPMKTSRGWSIGGAPGHTGGSIYALKVIRYA